MRVVRGAPLSDALAREASIAVLQYRDVVLAAMTGVGPDPLLGALAAVIEDATVAAGLARPTVHEIVERACVRLSRDTVEKLTASALLDAVLTYAGRSAFDPWARWTVSTSLGRHLSRPDARIVAPC